MLTFNKRKIALIVALASFFTTAFAVTPNKPAVGFSANHIVQVSNKQQSLLTGNVKIFVGKQITITGEKALVKYQNSKVSEFVIYGKGTYTTAKQQMQFNNATFNPQTGRLIADEIKHSH